MHITPGAAPFPPPHTSGVEHLPVPAHDGRLDAPGVGDFMSDVINGQFPQLSRGVIGTLTASDACAAAHTPPPPPRQTPDADTTPASATGPPTPPDPKPHTGTSTRSPSAATPPTGRRPPSPSHPPAPQAQPGISARQPTTPHQRQSRPPHTHRNDAHRKAEHGHCQPSAGTELSSINRDPDTVDPGRAEQTRPMASRSFVQWRAPPGRHEPGPLHGVWVDGGRDGSRGGLWFSGRG